jgi:hypothetical protein
MMMGKMRGKRRRRGRMIDQGILEVKSIADEGQPEKVGN